MKENQVKILVGYNESKDKQEIVVTLSPELAKKLKKCTINEKMPIQYQNNVIRYKVKRDITADLYANWEDIFRVDLIDNKTTIIDHIPLNSIENYIGRLKTNIKQIIVNLYAMQDREIVVNFNITEVEAEK